MVIAKAPRKSAAATERNPKTVYLLKRDVYARYGKPRRAWYRTGDKWVLEGRTIKERISRKIDSGEIAKGTAPNLFSGSGLHNRKRMVSWE